MGFLLSFRCLDWGIEGQWKAQKTADQDFFRYVSNSLIPADTMNVITFRCYYGRPLSGTYDLLTTGFLLLNRFDHAFTSRYFAFWLFAKLPGETVKNFHLELQHMWYLRPTMTAQSSLIIEISPNPIILHKAHNYLWTLLTKFQDSNDHQWIQRDVRNTWLIMIKIRQIQFNNLLKNLQIQLLLDIDALLPHWIHERMEPKTFSVRKLRSASCSADTASTCFRTLWNRLCGNDEINVCFWFVAFSSLENTPWKMMFCLNNPNLVVSQTSMQQMCWLCITRSPFWPLDIPIL